MMMGKKSVWGIIFLALLMSFSAAAEIADRIAAVVGNQVVTQSELDRAYAGDELGILKGSSGTAGSLSKRDYLDKMIEKMLIDQEVKKQGISVSVLEVEQAIEKKRAELGMDQEDFLHTLRNQGLTLDQYREQTRQSLVLAKLVSKEVRSEIEISDQEIQLYYQQHQAEFKASEKIHFYHLVVRAGEGAPEKIKKVQDEFSQGVAFTELAKKYSEGEEAAKGGDLGWVEVNYLKPELAGILEKVGINQLSPVYQDEVGYHLFWVQGREQGLPQTLDQVKPDIQQILERKQFEERYQIWLERLRAKAYVEIRL